MKKQPQLPPTIRDKTCFALLQLVHDYPDSSANAKFWRQYYRMIMRGKTKSPAG